MEMTIADIRRIVREMLLDEFNTCATVGIFGYPTPGPFMPNHMPPRKKVTRRSRRALWNGRVN